VSVFGIIGDIHGNREALEAALGALDALAVERIVCVGDLIGYNADPDDCVAMVRERGILSIAGNHDLIGTGRLGFDRCSNKAMHALKRTRRMLRPDTAGYLRSLPPHWRIADGVLLIHGGVRDVQQYMTHPKHVIENAAHLRADFPDVAICFFGHTHEQGIFACEGATVAKLPFDGGPATLAGPGVHFVNPGSVDASRKKGAKLAEFAVFDGAASSVTFHRVPYDAASVEAKAAAGGFRIERWRDRLYSWERRLGKLFRPAMRSP
jgi:predicted phosphodiesterase